MSFPPRVTQYKKTGDSLLRFSRDWMYKPCLRARNEMRIRGISVTRFKCLNFYFISFSRYLELCSYNYNFTVSLRYEVLPYHKYFQVRGYRMVKDGLRRRITDLEREQRRAQSLGCDRATLVRGPGTDQVETAKHLMQINYHV